METAVHGKETQARGCKHPVLGDLRWEERRRREGEKWYNVSIGVKTRPVRVLLGGTDESDTKINVANRCFEEIWRRN